MKDRSVRVDHGALKDTLVVFSHLRWNFVSQRPQHLMSRFASRRRVVFVEEPVPEPDAKPHWQFEDPLPNLRICRPVTPHADPGFSSSQMPIVQGLMTDLDHSGGIAWLYTPMALPLAMSLEPAVVVYDCMDELSLFLHAPPELLPREADLLRRADLVFTGGPSLYRSKKRRHPNVHCFPSSVHAEHFRQARAGTGSVREPDDQARLPKPRLGYFGVLDERLDGAILDALASAHPEWQIVMIGPVAKIDPESLPRRPNLHYLGQRRYDELPGYLSGWDVCLLPFAINDATRFISPTKTLEYMAAERMIVSTPIADVAEPYGHVVYLGQTPSEFVRACEAALAVPDSERQIRVRRMRQVLSNTSWDATAEAMDRLIDEAVSRRRARAVEEASPARTKDGLIRARHTESNTA